MDKEGLDPGCGMHGGSKQRRPFCLYWNCVNSVAYAMLAAPPPILHQSLPSMAHQQAQASRVKIAGARKNVSSDQPWPSQILRTAPAQLESTMAQSEPNGIKAMWLRWCDSARPRDLILVRHISSPAAVSSGQGSVWHLHFPSTVVREAASFAARDGNDTQPSHWRENS